MRHARKSTIRWRDKKKNMKILELSAWWFGVACLNVGLLLAYYAGPAKHITYNWLMLVISVVAMLLYIRKEARAFFGPVYYSTVLGGWVFWDGAWTVHHGPYATQEEAMRQYDAYRKACR